VGELAASSWALVPVKRRAECKSRLAGRLTVAERIELVRRMLAHVVETLQQVSAIEAIAFVSEERDTIPSDMPVLAEAGGGLNVALDAARKRLIARDAQEILVLPADLPCVTAVEIEALVAAGRRTGCALATDNRGRGTNALWLPTHLPFRFQFGAASRLLHLGEARRLGVEPALIKSHGLAFDVDGPQDLARLLARRHASYLSFRSRSKEAEWRVIRRTHCA
jgi:2-phospho-L-lactate guanylyltransferase